MKAETKNTSEVIRFLAAIKAAVLRHDSGAEDPSTMPSIVKEEGRWIYTSLSGLSRWIVTANAVTFEGPRHGFFDGGWLVHPTAHVWRTTSASVPARYRHAACARHSCRAQGYVDYRVDEPAFCSRTCARAEGVETFTRLHRATRPVARQRDYIVTLGPDWEPVPAGI